MQAHEIMSGRIVTVEMDDSLETVKEIFDHVRFHHLLVVESGKLSGVISDRDLLKVLSPNIGTPTGINRDRVTLNKRAHQIMSRNPVMVLPASSLHDVIAAFRDNAISIIPVVDPDNRPLGIVSWRDLLDALDSCLDLYPEIPVGNDAQI